MMHLLDHMAHWMNLDDSSAFVMALQISKFYQYTAPQSKTPILATLLNHNFTNVFSMTTWSNMVAA